MSNMFCYQCEQTAGGKGCTMAGVCGKSAGSANLPDDLTLSLINFALGSQGQEISRADAHLMMEGLFTTITNVNFDDVSIRKLVARRTRRLPLNGLRIPASEPVSLRRATSFSPVIRMLFPCVPCCCWACAAWRLTPITR
jgi:hypothetical protein